MRKLLNTIYVTNENAYLSLDNENLVCKVDNEKILKIPLDNIESIVSFSYLGCSPALMAKCVEKSVSLAFISPYGKFQARIGGPIHGNVHSRIAQIEKFSKDKLILTKNTIAAKLYNCVSVINRSKHDNSELRSNDEIQKVVDYLKLGINHVYEATTVEEILGIEGNCAKQYFSIFGKLFSKDNAFEFRSKRPPLDPVNAVLSFLYTLYTNEYAAAIEAVGLDSYIGFYHKLRSGRNSLACDLIEEGRCHVERITITLFNLKILGESDFENKDNGAVWLNDEGRKKVLTKWQEKKKTDIMHPYLKQKIQFGLLPYVQSNLLSKYIRGEIKEYPSFLNK
jgi:CRISPR-associated protein Cas1